MLVWIFIRCVLSLNSLFFSLQFNYQRSRGKILGEKMKNLINPFPPKVHLLGGIIFLWPHHFQGSLSDLQPTDILFLNKSKKRKDMNWGHSEYIKQLMPWNCHLILTTSLQWFTSKQWILENLISLFVITPIHM